MPYFESKHIYASSQNSKIHQIFSKDLNFIFKNDLESYIEEGMLLRWHSGKGFMCQCRKQETWVRSLGQEIPWRRAWQPTPVFLPVENSCPQRIPWTEEPGGLQSVGLHRVRHD